MNIGIFVSVEGKYVIPGLVDVHTHGIAGYDFNYAKDTDIPSMIQTYAKAGTTSIMATLASDSVSHIMNSIFAINQNRLNTRPGHSNILGVHMEGRYLNPDMKGAHNIQYLALPNAKEINTLVLSMMPPPIHFSMAPELPGAMDFISQAKELNAIYESGTDALILITNRLDINNEGDDVFIANAEKLLKKLPKDVKLGLYECPYPYKRLVTEKILDWCKKTGRFTYMKDTCCDADMIKERIEQLKGSGFKLLNANCQTLLRSMRDGGDGYCGIMCNFHPALYSWLAKNYNDERADLVQSVIGTFGFTESGLPYPLTAKYHMSLCGIPTELTARNRKGEVLSEYAKDCMRQMKTATDYFENLLGGNK